MEPPLPWRGELDHLGKCPRAALLSEAEQRHEDLRRRDGVRQRAMTGVGGGAEEVRELP